MLVRLLRAATIVAPYIGETWFPAGAEAEIPDASFDPVLHEAVVSAAPAGESEPPEPEPWPWVNNQT